MSNQEFSPSQFALDAGWDFACIEATAANGVSEVDAETITAMGFGDAQVAELLAHCRALVAADLAGRIPHPSIQTNQGRPGKLGEVEDGWICVIEAHYEPDDSYTGAPDRYAHALWALLHVEPRLSGASAR